MGVIFGRQARGSRGSGIALLALALVFGAGVGGGRSLAHVGGPSRLVSTRAYAGDLLLVVLAVIVVVFAVVAYAFGSGHRRRRSDEPELVFEREPGPWWTPWLAVLLAVALIGGLVAALLLLPHHTISPRTPSLPSISSPGGTRAPPTAASPRSTLPAVHWWGIAIVVGLLLAGGLGAWRLARRERPALEEEPANDPIQAALELSLDDLEREPDPRRAVIKAYGRMEAVLDSRGIGRRPFETSLEFLARSLVALRVSRSSVERLTSLFERAKFSQHEVDASMKRDALVALTSVRDELQEDDR